MQTELVEAAGFQRIDATIFPDIGPVEAVLAELETVEVRGGSVLEGEDQLMAGPIEYPIPPLSLTQTIRFFSSV